MKSKHLIFLGLHIILGAIMFFNRGLANIYFFSILTYFFIKTINAPSHVRASIILKACTYILGMEVLLRMRGGLLLYEANKYAVILFVVMGFVYNGFNKKAVPYVLYIALLIPGVYLSLNLLDLGYNIRKAIAFNLSGPVCLGLSALFCYGVSVTKKQLEAIISYAIYPLVSTLVYIFIYNPDVASASSGTSSNFVTSGGFGPNQVATVLGLGGFLVTVRFFYFSKTSLLKYVDLALIILFSFRALVTFSRGGVFTAVIMIFIFIIMQYKFMDKKGKSKMLLSIILFFLVAVISWGVSTIQTNGFLQKRYANQNARGEDKKDITTGRKDIFLLEFEEFINSPFLGVGVGRVKDLRFQKTGRHAASHNEMSRILSEHGLLGILAFLILLLVPLSFRIRDRSNVLFYSFYLFWILTINHSAMRIAAPAFIYALSLLHVKNETPRLHRKPLSAKA